MNNNSKEFEITVDGKRFGTDNQVITFDEIVKLSGKTGIKKGDYVLFINADSEPRSGLLSQGKKVIVSSLFPTIFQVVQN